MAFQVSEHSSKWDSAFLGLSVLFQDLNGWCRWELVTGKLLGLVFFCPGCELRFANPSCELTWLEFSGVCCCCYRAANGPFCLSGQVNLLS